MKALKITTTDEVKLIDIEDDYKAIQEAIDGRFDVVRLPSPGDLMLVDDEGRLKGKPLNKIATVLAQREDIIGDVLIVSEQGEDFGDVNIGMYFIAEVIQKGIKGEHLKKGGENVPIRIDYSSTAASKEKELAVRSKLPGVDPIEDLRQMVIACANELLEGIHLYQDDLFLYCAAMNHLIEALMTQLTDRQKELYEHLATHTNVITAVKKVSL